MKRKWIKVNDLSGNKYSANKNLKFKTRMLSSDLCYSSDAHIVEKRRIDLLYAATNENYKAEKDVAFENNVLFRSCISKINNTLIDNTEYRYTVMSMYNLLE